jgi:ubiquitin C-terminal hydrolase
MLSKHKPSDGVFFGLSLARRAQPRQSVGAGGRVAEEFGLLISQIWNANSSRKNAIIAPSAFKKTLDEFHSQFHNPRQQDVHELLAFMLDGLHEDLNRVLDKSCVPGGGSSGREGEGEGEGGREERELAVDAWRGHLMRNRSIVVDIFQGQLRSVLKCLTCNHKSLKFDPFMYMSVPCSTHTSTLHHCLSEFCRPEVLSSDCQWGQRC